MTAIKIIAYILAAILILFGVLFIWGAFSPEGSPGWIIVGLISVGIGLALIWFGSRQKPAAKEGDVTLQIDLPADFNLDAFKCEQCGAALTTENIEMVAGAPVVKCPYCGSTYQLSEEPKW